MIIQKLTPQELKTLLEIDRRNKAGQHAEPKLPISNFLQSLIDRGYLKTVQLYCGIFRVPTGDICLVLTEAGQMIVAPETTSTEERLPRSIDV